jgi:hypothetical protein
MMFRAFTAASILALTLTAAQAAPAMDTGGFDPRIHQTANDICGQLMQSSHYTPLFYQSWFKNCMHATSTEINRLVEARGGRYPAFAKN